MKIAKKSLSIFLSLLMIFGACSVGLNGLVAFAAEGDSEYSKQEVIDRINAATADGFTLTSSGDAWVYTADNGTALNAAEAIFDYAVNTYRDGNDSDSPVNSSAQLYNKFDEEFSSSYTNAVAARQLVKNVLNPDGTTVYPVEKKGTKSTTLNETTTAFSQGADVVGSYPIASYGSMYASTVASNIVKTVNVQINLENYLAQFAIIEDIPSTIITGVTYTYTHGVNTTATVSKVTTRDVTTGEGCDAVTTTYYTPTISTEYWNHLASKPTRKAVKDNTIRKSLLTYEKYFNAELLSTTKADMLAMDVEDIKSLYLTTESMYDAMVAKFSDNVLAHFGFAPAKIHQFMIDVDFAYRAVAAKYNIDNLNTLIGSTYNEESYAEMSALYAKTNTAYNVVFNLDAEIIAYLEGEGNYSTEYASALALKSAAESYNATLFDIMTEQKLQETVEAMVATYEDYINVLNKEDIENPSDAEVIGLVQKVEAFDAIIDFYKGYSYYRTYWTTEYEAAWAEFSAKLDEVYEVRGLKMEFETHYNYFLPLIYTTQIDTLDNAAAIALHSELDTKLTELRTAYTDVAAKWGYTIADKIFTVKYEDADYLLQTLVDEVKSAGKEAVKTVLIARTEAQLDSVYAYKDTTTVDFSNFASIKSTLTYFDYDLYNYVNGGGEGQNKWLSNDYTNKYSMVQTLLDRYHAFSTSDGKAFFNEDFTYADENGYYSVRYAGSKIVDDVEIGYPNDIARGGDDDTYVVTEDVLLDTIAKMDSFITSRDFGAIVGLVDADDEDVYVDIATYVEQMLNEMLYNDAMMNNLVGMIFPMVCELIEAELVGALGTMDGARLDENGVPWLDLSGLITDVSVKGELGLYLDTMHAPGNPEGHQKNFMEVFRDLGLYIYPATLAESLMMSNPTLYGIGTPIYEALKAADRDWTKLVCADDPETELVDETKVMEFEWGVYDEDTFIEVMASILDAILPLLQAVLTDKTFVGEASNAAVAYSSKITALGFLNSTNTFIRGGIRISINPLNAWNTIFVPLFEVLGVEKIPTVKSDSSGYDIADALIGTLLGRVEEILAAPLTSILDILPNLVYFLSMDSVQEIIGSLQISMTLNMHELDVYAGDGLGNSILSLLEGTLAGMIEFPIDLNLADEINLYDMLGFEISDFNEILKLATESLGIALPPMKQQDIIFCSDWTTNAAGRVDLDANEGDLIFWLIDYVVSALVPDENGNSLLTALLGEDMDPMLAGVIETVVGKLTSNPAGALGAIIEILNPAEYDLTEMNWLESQYNYNGIEGADQMSIVYLNYGNDWTREKSEYLLDNVNAIIDAVMELAGGEMLDLGALITDTINGLFTNANITALVKMLGGLGDSPSAIIADIVGTQVGIELDSWFTAFGYLYPVETWAEDAVVIEPDNRLYVNNFGVEGVANEDGTITWSFNKMPLNDGDGYTFINILSRLLGGASILIDFLFAGGDVSAFNGLLTLKGYETYASSLGLVFEMLGVKNLPTQEDFNNDSMGSFTSMLHAVLDRVYELAGSEDIISEVIALIPDLFYFVESNGLSTVLKNLLMPVWVLVDTVRPLIDVDLNGTLSLVVSEFLNYGTLDINTILTYVLTGVYQNNDSDYTMYSIDLFNLRFSELIKLADAYLGTNLAESGLTQVGIKGFCSGLEKVDAPVGTVYKPTLTAADTLTILVTAVLDCLSYPAADETKTNGDAIFALIAELTGKAELADMYPMIAEVIGEVEIEYTAPNWGYMFESADDFSLTLPEQSIVYLGYTTDWDKDTANAVYGALDDILNMFLPELLGENETIATLLNGLLEDNVYSDEILVTVVELIVNAISMLNEELRTTVDAVLDTDIAAWFDMCTYNAEAGAYEVTKTWGIDEAADKKAAFLAALKEVLAPAERLLSWLFFGNDIKLFTSSEKNDAGEYTYSDIITITGGEGYAYGIAPIFEALGCEMKPASAYATTGDAIEGILNEVFALVDEVSADPVTKAFDIIPNLIYFINADGIRVAVANLLAPVNRVVEKLAPFISEDGSKASIGALLEDTIGLDIENITLDTLLGIAADEGVVISADMLEIIKTLYVGKLAEFTSANGNKAYRLDVTGAEGDVVTIILSIALDLFNLNADLFSGLLGEETYYAVYNLIKGASTAFVYRDMNWAYMYEGEDAATQLFNNNLPERTGDAYEIYTQYQNNWNEATAEYLDEVLDTLVKDITDAARSDGSSLGQLLDTAIADGIYHDSILNSLIEMVVELLVDYEDLIAQAGALIDAEGLAVWFDEYCEITTDENGETVVTCVKDWGIDSAATPAEKRTAFVEAFVETLRPAYRLLAWLFFGEDFTFFNGTTNDVLITIKGGEGYNEAFVPLLEGLSATMNYEGNFSGIKPASEFYVDGELDMEMAVRDIFTAVTDWLAAICGDVNGNGTLGAMLEKLPNFLYFVNADGLKVVVNNLLQPVNFVIDALGPMGVEVDFATLIEGIDITDFDFYAVFDLLEDLVGLYFPEYTQEFLATFYIGQVVPYESANGKLAYYMTYSDAEPRRDMITVLISFVVDAFVDERNDAQLSEWLGEDIYKGIIAVLGIQGVKAMQEFSWILTEYADTDKTFTGLETSKKFNVAYNKIWSEDKAEYIAENFPEFVDIILELIGLEISGYKVTSLDTLLDSLLNGNLYTQATADSLLATVKDLIAQISQLEPYGEYVVNILDKALGVDLTAWDTMTLTVVDGDQASFVAALEQIVAPIVPLLDLLLCSENIELFYSIDGTGRDALTIYGSEGYAYGIVPLFEALGCTMMAPAEFKALDDAAKVGAIINPLLDRVNAILADPANELMNMLPGIIYFINSNGLDTAVNNIINSVDTVLIALEPLIGETSLMALLGVDLKTLNFENIMAMAADAISDSTGLDITAIVYDFIAELTTGKVVSYTSANGETYYTMQYAGEWQKSDMVTIVLRLVIEFLAEGENADAIIALIGANSQGEDATSSASSLIKFILTAIATEPVSSGAMATLYWIFYGLNEAAEAVDQGKERFNHNWSVILTYFESMGDPVTSKAAEVLRDVLDTYFDGIFDSEGVAPEGAMTFFEKIAEFFRKIGEFFKKLFGMA